MTPIAQKLATPHRGVKCGSTAESKTFQRCLKALEAENIFADLADVDVEKLWAITLSKGIPAKPNAGQASWRDRVALGGCAIVAFALIFVFVAGLGAIISWFQ